MESENIYQNVKELAKCQRTRAGGKRESLKPDFAGCRVQSMEAARRNLSPSVIYTLLGVCILLSIVVVIITVMLTIQYSERTQISVTTLQAEISRLKGIADNYEMALGSIVELQNEILQQNMTAINSEKTLHYIAKIQDEMSQLRNNTEMLLAGVKNELSQWKSNATINSEKTLLSIAKIQDEILQLRNNLRHCPIEWTWFRKSCYQFFSEKKTWADARTHCASVDAHLVVINGAEEQDLLRRNVQNRYWIGLSDAESEGDWRWVDGTDYSSSSKNWRKGEPNDAGGTEDCVEILVNGEWNDLPCTIFQHWICEKSALNLPSV